VIEAQTGRSDSINRSTEHEFFSQPLRDEPCPAKGPERHAQVELTDTIATDTGDAAGTGPINHRVEWKCAQLVSEVRKLADVSLMAVIEQQRGCAGAGQE
jgi:hypothetical protein